MMTRRDVIGEPAGGEDMLAGPLVRALPSGQQGDGGFGVHWYRKWTGAHWRLVQLVGLEIPQDEPRAVAAAHTVLQALTTSRRRVTKIHGLPLSQRQRGRQCLGRRLSARAGRRCAGAAVGGVVGGLAMAGWWLEL